MRQISRFCSTVPEQNWEGPGGHGASYEQNCHLHPGRAHRGVPDRTGGGPSGGEWPGADVRSYAAVVGAPAQKKIVKRTDDGVESVCRILVPTVCQRRTPQSEQGRCGQEAAGIQVNPRVPPASASLISSHSPGECGPSFGPRWNRSSRIIDILMSDAVVQFTQTSAALGAAPGSDHA